jgi:DNA-binding IclR family transcriptional regulator
MMRDILKYFENQNSLKVILVLYRDNPDLPLRDIIQETGLPQDRVGQILSELVSNDLVNVNLERDIQLYSLNETVRIALNRIGIAQQQA